MNSLLKPQTIQLYLGTMSACADLGFKPYDRLGFAFEESELEEPVRAAIDNCSVDNKITRQRVIVKEQELLASPGIKPSQSKSSFSSLQRRRTLLTNK